MKYKSKIQTIIFLVSILTITSCSLYNELHYKELFLITDTFVESIYCEYVSYNIWNALNYKKITTDGYYQIIPNGRLINVKILDYVDDEEYEKLKNILYSHYKEDTRVNEVYRCQAGTLMIDCRKK